MKSFRLPPVIRKALGTASKIASAVGNTIRPFLNNGLKKLSALSLRFIKSIKGFFVRTGRDVRYSYTSFSAVMKTDGFVSAVSYFFKGIWRMFCLHKKYYLGAINYIIIIAFVPIMILLVNYYGNMTVALKVTFNGSDVGYISEAETYDEAYAMMQSRIIDENDAVLTNVPIYSMAFVPASDLLEADELCDNMILSAFDEISYAAGLYAGDELLGAVEESDLLEDYLEDYLEEYQNKYPDCTVSFADAETVEGYYPLGSIMTVDEIAYIVTQESELQQMTYIVKEGDTYTSISTTFSMTAERLLEINGLLPEADDDETGDKNSGKDKPNDTPVNILETVSPPTAGDVLKVEYLKDVLSIKYTYVEEYISAIQYETENVADSTHYIGYSIVEQRGSNGSANMVAEVSYVYGVETERKIIKNVTLVEPVNEVVVVGTRVSNSMQSSSDYYSAKYYFPVRRVRGCYISAYYGDNRNHLGLDIAAPKGTDIYAADTGTVAAVGYEKGGYGHYLRITHSDGFQTFYAHCSQVLVKIGDRVARGDLVAFVGSTGYSTGNHLHFEVRLGRDRLDPSPYLGLTGSGTSIPGNVDTNKGEDNKDEETDLPSDYSSSLEDESSSVSGTTSSKVEKPSEPEGGDDKDDEENTGSDISGTSSEVESTQESDKKNEGQTQKTDGT